MYIYMYMYMYVYMYICICICTHSCDTWYNFIYFITWLLADTSGCDRRKEEEEEEEEEKIAGYLLQNILCFKTTIGFCMLIIIR